MRFRLNGRVRSRVDHRFDILDGFLSRFSDGVREAAVILVEQCIYDLFLALAHFGLGVLIRRVLVFRADLDDVGLDAEFVERAFEEHRFGRKTIDVKAARGRHEDLFGGRRDVVFAVHAELHVGVNGLARGAQIGDRVAQFIRLAPADAREIDIKQNSADAVVDLCLADLRQKARERLRLAHAKCLGERLFGHVIRQIAGNIEHEHAVLRNARPPDRIRQQSDRDDSDKHKYDQNAADDE